MAGWCRSCAGPLDAGRCANCGTRTFEERRADAAERAARWGATTHEFVGRYVTGDITNYFDALVDHFLPNPGPPHRRLLFREEGLRWQLELVEDGRPVSVVEMPRAAALYFATILSLLSRREPGAHFLSKLPPACVSKIPSGFAIARDA